MSGSGVWLDFYEGRASIQKVLAAYDEHGFDANQDLPGNMLWEEMFDASPKGTKVILTIRESDEKWWNSWCGFLKQARLNFEVKSCNPHRIKLNHIRLDFGQFSGQNIKPFFEVQSLSLERKRFAGQKEISILCHF